MMGNKINFSKTPSTLIPVQHFVLVKIRTGICWNVFSTSSNYNWLLLLNHQEVHFKVCLFNHDFCRRLLSENIYNYVDHESMNSV